MMSTALAEDEHTKNPIISMLEADVKSKHVKTFYNGIQGSNFCSVLPQSQISPSSPKLYLCSATPHALVTPIPPLTNL